MPAAEITQPKGGVAKDATTVILVAALGDLYKLSGDDALAQQQYDLVGVIEQLLKSNGVNRDLELAPYVHAADVLSWALYKSGRYEGALQYSREARRLGSKDPLFLFHAGMIHSKLGGAGQARAFLSAALHTNDQFSLLHSATAKEELQRLEMARQQLLRVSEPLAQTPGGFRCIHARLQRRTAGTCDR